MSATSLRSPSLMSTTSLRNSAANAAISPLRASSAFAASKWRSACKVEGRLGVLFRKVLGNVCPETLDALRKGRPLRIHGLRDTLQLRSLEGSEFLCRVEVFTPQLRWGADLLRLSEVSTPVSRWGAHTH
eukprot:CAMPEP_0115661214 /NCGR_PEP_ID=MMETSP0272-20121206/46666_1 /TAXON_ID=71861 /ORGANISM="Scrippsiella trochoidea, Strain CCMP3099" /LENGTH=129 /DNA_ID=CAMNT_0003099437 /DNA_START=188 /DNA_END=577 /DNA_ORIENTATION=-